MPVTDEIQFRNSERQTFTTCPQKWWWAYVNRLRGDSTSLALLFGTLAHSAMEAFYLPGTKRGPRPAITFEKLYEEVSQELYYSVLKDREGDGEWHDFGELGVELLTDYYETYGRDERWYVVGTEAPFRVPTMDRKTGLEFTVVGVVDGLWADRTTANKPRKMKLYVADHKTTSDDPTKKDQALQMDEQVGTYWSYGVDYYYKTGILHESDKLAGMIFNFLRKGRRDDRETNELGQALNKDGTVSKRQPVPRFHRSIVYRDRADGEMVRLRTEQQARMMHYMRQGKLPVTKTPGSLFHPHCNWCEFREMCELHEIGADWREFRDLTFKTWDPYEQHEIKLGDQGR